jgi:hypothetical protein
MTNFIHAFRGSALALALTLGTSLAMADTFDVKSADVDKGETEVELNNSLFPGFPRNADRLRTSHEFELNHGFTSWLKAGAKMNFEKPADDDFQISTAGIQALGLLKKFEGGVGIAWFTGLDFRIHREETNSVTFGPVVQLGTEKTHLLLNPFFSKTFGPNREEGMDFSLGWAVKHELREGFAIGIEGYSTFPNISNSPGSEFQDHRIGPVVYLERALGGGGHRTRGLSVKDTRGGNDDKKEEGPKLGLEIGVLFGLSDAAQDTTFKIKGGISF